MSNPASQIDNPRPTRSVRQVMACCALLWIVASGCTAFHPVRGIPASYLPNQFLGPSRDDKRMIDLGLLVRSQPEQHHVAAGDVLSIYVPRVLGSRPTEVTTVGIEPPINMPLTTDDPPTIGYPIQVRDDNTISLPQIPPLQVGGMTLEEVEDAITRAYTVDHQILNPAEAMVLVSLQRARVHRVLVVRQESGTTISAGSGPGMVNIGSSGRGTARTVTLKAYENDVLHALALVEGADGLPGQDAENAIYIIRQRPRNCPPTDVPPDLPNRPPVIHSPGVPLPHGPELSPTPAPQDRQHPIPAQPPVSSQTIRGQGQDVRHHLPAIQQAGHQVDGRPNPLGGYRSSVTPVSYLMASAVSPDTMHGHSFLAPPSPVSAPVGLAPPTQPDSTYSREFGGHSISDWSPELAPPGVPYGAPPAVGQPFSSPDANWARILQNFDPTIDNPNVIRIPIRLAPGEVPHITEDDITLLDGDIVFIESRETEVFYTAGLLGGGQYTLPRDYDLGVLEAIAIAGGRTSGMSGQGRSIGGMSALNHDVTNSASRLAIIRTLPNGSRVNIEVDLHKAMRYPQENIRVQPGDILILEYTFPEAIVATTQRFLLEGALIGLAASFVTGGGGGGN